MTRIGNLVMIQLLQSETYLRGHLSSNTIFFDRQPVSAAKGYLTDFRTRFKVPCSANCGRKGRYLKLAQIGVQNIERLVLQ